MPSSTVLDEDGNVSVEAQHDGNVSVEAQHDWWQGHFKHVLYSPSSFDEAVVSSTDQREVGVVYHLV